jgi:hypothetical protein
MKAQIELSQEDIYKAINQYIEQHLQITINPSDVVIETKSKQNYKSEWEVAAIRASFTSTPGPT